MSMFKEVPESSRKRRRRRRRDKVLPLSPAPSMSKSGGGGKSRELEQEEDVVTVLNAVIEFRANNNGSTPTPRIMTPLFDAIKDSLNQSLTVDQLYRRFRTLKNRYRVKSREGPTTLFDHQFLDLSVRAWGEKEKEIIVGKKRRSERINTSKEKKETAEEEGENDDCADANEEDARHSFSLVTEKAMQHWKTTGMVIPLMELELGLKFMNKEHAALLEKKWEKHAEAGWEIEAKICDVKKEYLAALCGAGEIAKK